MHDSRNGVLSTWPYRALNSNKNLTWILTLAHSIQNVLEMWLHMHFNAISNV